jgi:hypothetical protein
VNVIEGRFVEAAPSVKGPARGGHSVIVDGRKIPNIAVFDNGGDMVEFVLDDRLSFSFPREWSRLAASFAAQAMAIGAGHPSIGAPHKSGQAFATPVMELGSLDG